jgi:hypothetical protein
MFPDDIARRHDDMPGYELVDFAEIALPLWQLSVEAISIAHRRFPPIQEFVLQGVAAGLSKTEVSGFLGLEQSVVDGTVTQLVLERLIRESEPSDTGEVELALTEDGIRALDDEGIAAPVEDQFQIFFDGISRLQTFVPSDQLAHPRETEAGRLVELPALPPVKPEVTDLKVADVQQLLAQQSGGRSEFGRDIVSLKKIARHRRMFRRGIGLVFKGKKDRGDLRLRILVGGVLATETERQFAERGGLARPGFVRAFSDNYLNSNLRRHLGRELASAILDDDEATFRRREYSVAKLRLQALERRLVMAASDEISRSDAPTKAEYEKAKDQLEAASQALAQPGARPAMVYEQPEFLRSALKGAKTSISISSLGLSSAYVNPEFVLPLEAALKRGVAVTIIVNRQAWERDKDREQNARPYVLLTRMQSKYKKLELDTSSENRYFHLCLDGQAALVSNRSFLSNNGKNKTFEQYSGYFIQTPALTGRYLARVG